MAGQPQENPWSQQGHGYSQGAPYQNYQPQQQPPAPQSYEQPAYEQPAYDQTQVYEQSQPTAYQQQPPYEQQAYAQEPPQAYAGQPQPGQPQPGQGQPDSRGQQGWEQWQLPQQQARPQARQKQNKQKQKKPRPASGESGFVGSLFDFSFSSFVTPKIIKALYALVAVWTLLWAVLLLFIGNKQWGTGGLLAVLIIVDPILILVSLGTLRVVLEFFMVTFRMQEDLRALRDRVGATAGGGGDTVAPGTTGTNAV